MQPAGHAQLLAGRNLALHINLRSGILAHQHGREPWANPMAMQLGDLRFQFSENFVADFQAVQNACGHLWFFRLH